MTQDNETIPIILCAGPNGRAVIYGRVESEPEAGQPVTLRGARMIIRWAGDRGLFGVAERGPESGSNVSPVVSTVYETSWLSWLSCSDDAAAAIEAWS